MVASKHHRSSGDGKPTHRFFSRSADSVSVVVAKAVARIARAWMELDMDDQCTFAFEA
jgi:hypothetical protein